MVDVAIWMGFSNLINGVPNHHFLIFFQKNIPESKHVREKKISHWVRARARTRPKKLILYFMCARACGPKEKTVVKLRHWLISSKISPT